MKTLISLIMMTAAMAFGQATVLNWVSDEFSTAADGNPDIVDSSGTPVNVGMGWLVEIYTTAETTVNSITDGTPSGYTTTVAQGSLGAFGSFADDSGWASLGGMSVFTVIFNAATVGSASEYVIVDGSGSGFAPITLPPYVAPPGAEQFTYNAGSVIAEDWNTAVIPEPSTYAMILLGGGLLIYRRKYRN